MKQYEPCIQNNNNNNNNNIIIIIIKMGKKNQLKGAERASGGERVGERELFFFLSILISQIYENRTLDFCRG